MNPIVHISKALCFWRPDAFKGSGSAGAKSREIDRSIRSDKKRKGDEVKILLLGAGDSGKSTILKQMKLLYTPGFSEQEKSDYRSIIFLNILDVVKILSEVTIRYALVFENPQNKKFLDTIDTEYEIAHGEFFPPEYAKAIKSLWADSVVRKTIRTRTELMQYDNIAYYLDNINRISGKSFVPTDLDILYSRHKTTGITETVFDSGLLKYRMVDVGGQRTERKKWIHCFENVTAILFLAAISDYDQRAEDDSTTQLNEAYMLFEMISNSQWFIHTAIILFLNKMDIFKSRLDEVSVRKAFPEYGGDRRDPLQVARFVQRRFERLCRDQNKEIYSHFTTATDTNLLKVVMESVRDTILKRNMDNLLFEGT